MIGYIQYVIHEIKIWWEFRKLNKLLDGELKDALNVDPISKERLTYVQDDTQKKYQEGVLELKRKVNTAVKSRTADEYDKVLKDMEMLGLARDETKFEKQWRRMRELNETRHKKDIKTKKDENDYIDIRIQHWENKKQFDEEKVLRREIRKLERAGKTEAAKELFEIWKDKYGR